MRTFKSEEMHSLLMVVEEKGKISKEAVIKVIEKTIKTRERGFRKRARERERVSV